jgi:hypothetical protein
MVFRDYMPKYDVLDRSKHNPCGELPLAAYPSASRSREMFLYEVELKEKRPEITYRALWEGRYARLYPGQDLDMQFAVRE